MGQYIQFVADVLLTSMGLPRLYNVTNPYAWMTMIGMPARQDFFEGRVSEYKQADKCTQSSFVYPGGRWPSASSAIDAKCDSASITVYFTIWFWVGGWVSWEGHGLGLQIMSS